MSLIGDLGGTKATNERSIPTSEDHTRGDDGPTDDENATIGHRERSAGVPGPPPGDEHNEIRWAAMGGADVVIKAARQPHRARLRREAEVLARMAVEPRACVVAVEFLELTEGADHTELVTCRHGSVTLAEVGLLNPSERTTALLSLCEAVDSLHAAGWVHSKLEPSHVLVLTAAPMRDVPPRNATPRTVAPDCSGWVRICSFAHARQPPTSECAAERSLDREALTSVVLQTLEAPGGFGTPRERRRYERAARRARDRLSRTRGLLDGAGINAILLDTIGKAVNINSARVPEPVPSASGRPTTPPGSPATIVAPTDRTAANTDAPDETRIVRSPRSRSKRWRTSLVVVGAFLCVSTGAVLARALHSVRGLDAASECTIDVGSAHYPCDSARINDNVVTIGDQVLEIGGTEDTLIVDDWNCDGSGTVVLLENSTGRLFHFGSWSTGSSEVTGEEIGRFQDATGLKRGEPCAYPDVELADGSRLSPLELHGTESPAGQGPRVDGGTESDGDQ